MDLVPLALERKHEGFKSIQAIRLFYFSPLNRRLITEGAHPLKEPLGGSDCFTELEKCEKEPI